MKDWLKQASAVAAGVLLAGVVMALVSFSILALAVNDAVEDINDVINEPTPSFTFTTDGPPLDAPTAEPTDPEVTDP